MLEPVIEKIRKREGKCSNYGCQRDAKGKFCGSCRTRQSRLKDPIRYAFNNLKNRAKQRGKEFTLTIEQFTSFCHKTEYIKGKGKTIGSFNVDRIDETKGYTIDNIQCLDKQDNIKKYYLNYDYINKTAKAVTYSESDISKDDLPF